VLYIIGTQAGSRRQADRNRARLRRRGVVRVGAGGPRAALGSPRDPPFARAGKHSPDEHVDADQPLLWFVHACTQACSADAFGSASSPAQVLMPTDYGEKLFDHDLNNLIAFLLQSA